MAIELKRGCGYRRVGSLYLCGSGISIICDRLPFLLKYCPTCGSGIQFSRAFQWLDWGKYAGKHHMQETEHLISAKVICSCNLECSVCWPGERPQPYGLLWVGEAYYSTEHFISEALRMGVSKKIAFIPKELVLGETVVLLAHKKAIISPAPELYHSNIIPGASEENIKEDIAVMERNINPEYSPGIFYAFIPTAVEMPIYSSEFTKEKGEELLKRNITPIIIPDGDLDHSSSERITTALDPVTKRFSRVLLEEE